MVPSLITRSWLYLGQDSTLVPVGISVGFFATLTALFWSALKQLRGSSVAAIGLCILLSAVRFVQLAMHQTGDLPLGFYSLLALVTLSFWLKTTHRGWLILTGITLGGAAWTKNEGVLFALIVFGVITTNVHNWRRTNWRHSDAPKNALLTALSLVLGIAPAFLTIVFFKITVAPTNDLLLDNHDWRTQMFDLHRARVVAKYFMGTLQNFGDWNIPFMFVLLFYASVLGFQQDALSRQIKNAGFVILVGMLYCHASIYMATPYPLEAHLQSSLARLLLQLWPVFVWWLMATLYSPPYALKKE